MIELNLNKLYAQAFGLNASMINKEVMKSITDLDSNSIKPKSANNLLYSSELIRTTAIGTALFMPCKIGGYQLPNEPLITVNLNKKIEETPLYGESQGSVIEIISQENYSLNIRGVALNYDSVYNYPVEQVEALNELAKRNEALEIICPLTEILGIEFIVIQTLNLAEMIGVQHAQAYSIKAKSDNIFILEG